MIIIETSVQGEHLIKKAEIYTLRNTETNQLSSISGEVLIKQLTADRRAKRPYRYANAKSSSSFVMYKEVSNTSVLVSMKGHHSIFPSGSSSIKTITINEDNTIFLVKLLNSKFITISVKKPELYDKNLGIFSARIGTHRETFSMNIHRDFEFHFCSLVERDNIVTADLLVYYTSTTGRLLDSSLGDIKISNKGIKYKGDTMPYITDNCLAKIILSGNLKDLLP